MNNNPINAEELGKIVNPLGRFSVPKKLKMTQKFFDSLVSSGTVRMMEGKANQFGYFGSITGVPVEIDNTVVNFEFEY